MCIQTFSVQSHSVDSTNSCVSYCSFSYEWFYSSALFWSFVCRPMWNSETGPHTHGDLATQPPAGPPCMYHLFFESNKSGLSVWVATASNNSMYTSRHAWLRQYYFNISEYMLFLWRWGMGLSLLTEISIQGWCSLAFDCLALAWHADKAVQIKLVRPCLIWGKTAKVRQLSLSLSSHRWWRY